VLLFALCGFDLQQSVGMAREALQRLVGGGGGTSKPGGASSGAASSGKAGSGGSSSIPAVAAGRVIAVDGVNRAPLLLLPCARCWLQKPAGCKLLCSPAGI
jgi:hypothetical protein